MTTDSKKLPSQSKNKNIVSSNSDKFYFKLKKFVERDEFGLFKLKANKLLDSKISVSDTKIKELIDLKNRAEQIYRNRAIKKTSLIAENKKIKDSLMVKLQGEVTR